MIAQELSRRRSSADPGNLIDPLNLIEFVHQGGDLALGLDLHHQIDLGIAVRQGDGIERQGVDLGGGQHHRHVHGDAGAVLGHELHRRFIRVQAAGVPAYLDPPGLLRRTVHAVFGVGAVRPVDGNPVAPGNEAHDLIAGDRGAALGELDHTFGHARHDDPGGGVLRAARLGNAGVHRGPGRRLLRLLGCAFGR